MPDVELFIDGAWTPAANGRRYDSRDPWSGEVIASVAAGDGDDTVAAVDAAARAFPAWSQSLPALRQGVLLRAAATLERRWDDVADLLRHETGCTGQFADVQLRFTTSLLRQSAALPYAPIGQVMPSDVPGTDAFALRRPVGVVGAIAPWNASLTLSGRSIAGPLALGNTVVLKPSEQSPRTGGALWAEIFDEAGLPPGALNVVTHAPGEAGAVGAALMSHRLVRRINFTGSTATGRRLAEAAGRHLKRTVLQLSGQNPLIVLADADLGAAVAAAAYGAFVHQGQVCMCARRIYVEASVFDEFAERFAARVATLPVGDPADPATVIGPVINEWALSLIARRVEEAVTAGARVLAGGTAAPPCYPATVLTDVPPGCELAVDETFGPVVILESVADADAAVTAANLSPFGLAAAVFSGDRQRGIDLARRLDAGIVHVNDQPVNDEPHMPFGGVKDSGWGRFGTGFAAEDFTELQWMTARTQPRSYPF